MSEVTNSTWTIKNVGDLVERHFCGPSPDCEERLILSEEEWGVLKTTAITWDGWDENAHKVLPRSYWNRPDIEVIAGDVLVTKAGPRHRVGVVAHVPTTRRRLVVSGKMIGLRPRKDLVQPEILSGLISLTQPQKYIQDRTTGMAESQVNFANDVLLSTPLHVPPMAEQRVIARIIRALDTSICQTEAIIAKLKQVKQGLLHDLLTRGIDANGELRPPQNEAPHLYKQSQLGWIPIEWSAEALGNIADLQVGFAFKSEWFRDSGQVKLLRGDNVGYGSPDWGGVKFLDGRRAAQFADYALAEGDVVVGMDRTFTNSGAKFSVVGSADLPCLLVQRVGRFIPSRCSMSFLRVLTLWSEFHRGLLIQQKGMDIPHLSKTEILEPLVPVPASAEQARIALRVETLEKRLEAELDVVQKLVSEKSGLMDDLLTGRVRVTPLLEATPA